jgi:hypothetical protein
MGRRTAPRPRADNDRVHDGVAPSDAELDELRRPMYVRDAPQEAAG